MQWDLPNILGPTYFIFIFLVVYACDLKPERDPIRLKYLHLYRMRTVVSIL